MRIRRLIEAAALLIFSLSYIVLAPVAIHAQVTTTQSAAPSCPQLLRNLSRGMRGTDVLSLQQFLTTQYSDFPTPTGYFGPFTQAAIQQWQASKGIVSSGTPATTGYGSVGPKTRKAFASCSSISATQASTSAPVQSSINIPIYPPSPVGNGGSPPVTPQPQVTPPVITAPTTTVLVSNNCPSGWICPATPVYSSTIGAWYEPWWKSSGTYAYQWTSWARYMPLLGYYDAGNPATIDAEFAAMNAAGIQYLVLDDTNFINSNTAYIQNNILSMFQEDSKLPAKQRLGLSIAIGSQLLVNKSLADQNAEADTIFNDFVPWSVYFKWHSKPLLINYNGFDTPTPYDPTWDDTRFTVRNAAGFVSSSSTVEQQYGTHGWWGWTQIYPQPVTSEEVGVSPGADNVHRTLTQPCSDCTYHLDREEGSLYKYEWLRAIAQNPETILLSSWNEFSDETAVEAATPVGSAPLWKDTYGTEVPDWYVQITTAYTNLRTGLMANGYYRDINNSTIYEVVNGQLVCQSAQPHGHPTIPLPAGLLAKLGAPTCT